MEINRVSEEQDGYVCYFDQHDGTVANLFHVDDVAYCNRFTSENTELKFYKRRVIAISQNSVTLTKGYEPVELPDGTIDTGVNGEGVPEVGDTIVQFGNYSDATRRYVKVRDVIGGGYERYIEELDSVNAAGKEYYFVGKQDGQNPRWFIGDKNGQYAEWKNNRLHINADLVIGPDSSGLGNLAEWAEVEEKIDGAVAATNDLEYLKEAFKEDDTVISGGVAIGSFIGVRDSGGNAISGMAGNNFLNGGIPFSNSDESCPTAYYGAKSVQDANNAKTRFYTSGKAVLTDAEVKGNIQAVTGKIGSLSIIGNDLVGINEDGVECVRIGIGSLPSVNNVFETISLPFDISSESEDVICTIPANPNSWYEAQASKLGEIFTDRDTNDHIDTAYLSAKVSFELPYYGNTVTFGRFSTNYKTISITQPYPNARLYPKSQGTAYLYRVIGSVRNIIAEWHLEEQFGGDITVNNLEAGRYEIDIYAEVVFSGDWYGNVIFDIGGGIYVTTNKQNVNAATFIAKDGILAYQSLNKYFSYSESNGFEVRFGNNGFRVNSNGVQKLVNSSWIDI